MNREQALDLVKSKIQNQNLIKHCLAVEVCMRALAKHFNDDPSTSLGARDLEKWGLVGLLHDIDYEETKNSPEKHSIVGAEMLEKMGLDKEITQAIKTHNEVHGIEPETKMAKALFCVDPLTGLIVAATLVMPDKKISNLTVKNILNRFKVKSFAKGANREIIKKCQDIDLDLKEFIDICLKAMQSISRELGL